MWGRGFLTGFSTGFSTGRSQVGQQFFVGAVILSPRCSALWKIFKQIAHSLFRSTLIFIRDSPKNSHLNRFDFLRERILKKQHTTATSSQFSALQRTQIWSRCTPKISQKMTYNNFLIWSSALDWHQINFLFRFWHLLTIQGTRQKWIHSCISDDKFL